jgi:hypothetical protein
VKVSTEFKRPKYLQTKKFDRMAKLVKDIYKYCSAGGIMHVVLDDGNFGDSTIEWTIDYAKKNKEETEQHIQDCIELCNLMLSIKECQRYWIWRKVYDTYGDITGMGD